MWYTRQSGLYRICFTIPFVDNAYFAKIGISTKLSFFRDQKINGKKKKDEKKNDSFTSTTNTSIKKENKKKRGREKETKKNGG